MLALVNHLFKIYFKVSDGLALFMYMYVKKTYIHTLFEQLPV